MKLLLKIMYDGSAYAGYQAQNELPSIQTALTKAAAKTLGFPCSVTGCSRTDAGVHALGFCCTVAPKDNALASSDWLKIPVGRFHRAIRPNLPTDISVCAEAAVGDSFHPRYSVKSKTYLYKMYDSPYSDPFLEKRAWHIKISLGENELERMRRAGAYIVGYRDFTSFMAAGSKITDAHRTVYSLDVGKKDGITELRITADGFLYNMVRIITGTLEECAAGRFSPEDIKEIIEKKDRALAGKTAPACGLYLEEVSYNEDIAWKII